MSVLWSWLLAGALAGEGLTLPETWVAGAAAPEAVLASVPALRGRAVREEARAWTNPTLDYQGYGRVQGTADAINAQQHQVDLGLPLPITGELGARLRRGRLAEELGEAQATTARASLGSALGDAWLLLVAAQEREVALAEAHARVLRLVDLTRRRAEEGAARPWDVDRLRLAASSLERDRAGAARDRLEASAQLAALLGRTDEVLEAQGDLSQTLERLAGLPEAAEAPQVQEARRAVALAEGAHLEARRSRIPTPELRLGGYWTTDGGSASVVAGLGWELPVIDRGQGRLALAEADRRAAAAELQRVEDGVVAELRALRAARDALVGVAAEEGVPTGAVLAAAEVAWREGEAGVLELVDAVSAEVQARLGALEARLALRRVELRLALLEGRLDQVVDPSPPSSSLR